MKQQQHQVSLKRPDGWYSADNEMIDVFAPMIGVYALGVYHLLKRRAFLKEKDRAISLVGIGEALGMSKEAARAAIATLREFGLLEMQSSKAANKAPLYEVIHAKDVLAVQATSSLRGNPQYPQLQAISRTLAKPNRERDIAHGEGDISPVSRRDLGRQTATSRLPNKEEVLKEKVQEQDTAPPTPEGGRNQPAEEQDGERTPRERAAFFLQYLHTQFANTFTVQKPGTDWEDSYAAWMRCFDHVRVGEVEADGNQMVVTLETQRPKDLVAGLTKYQAKVQLAMKKAFGREVQLVPRLEAA